MFASMARYALPGTRLYIPGLRAASFSSSATMGTARVLSLPKTATKTVGKTLDYWVTGNPVKQAILVQPCDHGPNRLSAYPERTEENGHKCTSGPACKTKSK
ncbi:hypothetical protein AA313_de0209646 [Arthrobotrys entomopaga]|nr:hypothetical protein AA313_de0209646 [Arthrobotrys entomopaga]